MEQKTKLTKMQLLAGFLKGSKRYFVASILASAGVTLLDMLLPQIIRTTVDSVLGNEPFQLPAALQSVIDTVGGAPYLRQHLYIIALLVILIALFGAVLKYGNTVWNAKGSETLVRNMRNRLFSHIQRLPFSWHMKTKTGDMIQRCTSDVDTVKNFLAEQLTAVFRIVILLTMSLIFLFSMHARLALVALGSLPIIVAYSAFFHGKIGAGFLKCDENEGVLSTIAQENLTGVRVVRAFGREIYEKERFEAQNNVYTNAWLKLSRLMASFWASGDLISGLQQLLIIVLGAYFCVKGDLTAGAFIAFLSYNAMMIWPVRQLGRMISEMSKAGVSIERIREILAAEPESDRPGAVRPDLSGDIVYDHVTFSYDSGAPVLTDVSFRIKSGTTFAILGGTGSGKSTLMLLLNRLYPLPPDCGKITISGVDIADISSDWLRQNIGMVLQEPFLFSRTIAENISIARPRVEPEEVRHAAAIACLDQSVMEFPSGYDTVVGERGVTLSGGQKQRTAIARTLLNRGRILVFDDSLSAVDAETDAKIRAALRHELGDVTVILISHRITTLMQADEILVLDGGRVAQQGTHQELIAQDGIYKQIYNIQMADTEETACKQEK